MEDILELESDNVVFPGSSASYGDSTQGIYAGDLLAEPLFRRFLKKK